jgi:hypothetical protein
MKYTHKMMLLRREMEEKRKRIILQIETKKNKAIQDLTLSHETKYKMIKDYYQEITNTNLDIIRQAKIDLNDAKTDD